MKLQSKLFGSFVIGFYILLFFFGVYLKNVNEKALFEGEVDKVHSKVNHLYKMIEAKVSFADLTALKLNEMAQKNHLQAFESLLGNVDHGTAGNLKFVLASKAVNLNDGYVIDACVNLTGNSCLQGVTAYLNQSPEIAKNSFFRVLSQNDQFLFYAIPLNEQKNDRKTVLAVGFQIDLSWLDDFPRSQISLIDGSTQKQTLLYSLTLPYVENHTLDQNQHEEIQFDKLVSSQSDNWSLEFILHKDDVRAQYYYFISNIKEPFYWFLLFTLPVAFLIAATISRPIEHRIKKLASVISDNSKMQRLNTGQLADLSKMELYLSNLMQDKKLIDQKLKAVEIKLTSEEKAHKLRIDFLSKIHNDLKETIQGNFNMMSSLERSKLSMQQKNSVTILKNSHSILQRYLDDYQNISKSFQGGIKFEKHPLDLENLLDEILSFARMEFKRKKQISFTKVSSDLPEYILNDEYRIRQVLTDVIKYFTRLTSQGEITLKAGARKNLQNSRIKIELVGDGKFKISDEIVDLINNFKHESHFYSQNNQLTLDDFNLFFVCQLLNQLKADFSIVYEQQNKHFVFKIEFDTVIPEKRDIDAFVEKQTKFNQGQIKIDSQKLLSSDVQKTILIIDNNLTNSKIMTIFLEDLNFKIIQVDNVKEGVDFLKNTFVDLIFMKLNLPVVSGYQGAKIIRKIESEESETLSEIPIVAIEENFRHQHENIILAGINDVITMPVRKADIEKLMKKWLKTYFSVEKDTSPVIDIQSTD